VKTLLIPPFPPAWILDIDYWILDIGYWILDIGYWILDIDYWILKTQKGLVEVNSKLP
jgi:hypothetical protein